MFVRPCVCCIILCNNPGEVRISSMHARIMDTKRRQHIIFFYLVFLGLIELTQRLFQSSVFNCEDKQLPAYVIPNVFIPQVVTGLDRNRERKMNSYNELLNPDNLLQFS